MQHRCHSTAQPIISVEEMMSLWTVKAHDLVLPLYLLNTVYLLSTQYCLFYNHWTLVLSRNLRLKTVINGCTVISCVKRNRLFISTQKTMLVLQLREQAVSNADTQDNPVWTGPNRTVTGQPGKELLTEASTAICAAASMPRGQTSTLCPSVRPTFPLS